MEHAAHGAAACSGGGRHAPGRLTDMNFTLSTRPGMMKRFRLMSAIAAALTLAACGKSEQAKPDSTAAKSAAGGGKKITIAMIAKSSNNPVFLAARTGADAAAKDLSEKNGINVTVNWLTPPEEDGQVQAQRIQQAVNDGADAILISCSDAGKVTGAINDAVNRGVPVMTFDSDAPQSKRFSYYGVDDIKTGQETMAELAKIMNGTFNHVETPQDAAAEVVRVDNAYPEIQGWAFIGGWPLFTTALLKDLNPAKIKVASVDAMPAELAYVDQGVVPVLLAQSVYKWGDVGVRTIVDKVYFKKDVPAMIPMELVRVSKDNLGAWAKQLKDWGFTDVDPKYLK